MPLLSFRRDVFPTDIFAFAVSLRRSTKFYRILDAAKQALSRHATKRSPASAAAFPENSCRFGKTDHRKPGFYDVLSRYRTSATVGFSPSLI
jgi:hypothetical protein